jgi:CheY-like chemotaxis protein
MPHKRIYDEERSVMAGIKVLLADDHAIVAEGLAALLKGAFDLADIVRDGRERWSERYRNCGPMWW